MINERKLVGAGQRQGARTTRRAVTTDNMATRSGEVTLCSSQPRDISPIPGSVNRSNDRAVSRRIYRWSKGTLRERCQLETQCNNPTMVTRRKRWRIRIINVEVPDDYYKDIIHERQSCPG